MTVLVCGGRDYADVARVNAVLSEYKIGQLIEGGARGADTIARRWALLHGVPVQTVHAEWDRLGKSAGMVRNYRMLGNKPDLVIAFPGGRGTAHMVRIARKAGVPVREV